MIPNVEYLVDWLSDLTIIYEVGCTDFSMHGMILKLVWGYKYIYHIPTYRVGGVTNPRRTTTIVMVMGYVPCAIVRLKSCIYITQAIYSITILLIAYESHLRLLLL